MSMSLYNQQKTARQSLAVREDDLALESEFSSQLHNAAWCGSRNLPKGWAAQSIAWICSATAAKTD
jgi:hypothetical protein